MMTGILGVVMWLVMAAMMLGMALGGITWLRHRRRHGDQREHLR